jgi:hypothetical protein
VCCDKDQYARHTRTPAHPVTGSYFFAYYQHDGPDQLLFSLMMRTVRGRLVALIARPEGAILGRGQVYRTVLVAIHLAGIQSRAHREARLPELDLVLCLPPKVFSLATAKRANRRRNLFQAHKD